MLCKVKAANVCFAISTVTYLKLLVPWENQGEQHCFEQVGAHYLARTYSQDGPGLADLKSEIVS